MRRSTWLLALPLLLAACPPSVDTGEDGGTGPIQVGSKGGIFVRAGFVLEVPAGAVADDTVIGMTTVDTGIPEVPGRTRISVGYRFSPKDLKLTAPLTLHLPWDDAKVPPAVDPASFDMRRQYGTDPYLQLPQAKTNLAGPTNPFPNNVQAQTDHLGLFWLTSPSEPNIARVELTPDDVVLNVGDTRQFDARVVDPAGGTLASPVTLAVLPPRVGEITPAGLFTAKDPGVATLTATAGKQSAKVTVRVRGSATGPGTFAHQNPFPTGNDLYGGTLAPGGLGTIFCGGNGTVLAKSAAGQWSRLFSTPGVVLKAVGGTTAANAIAVGSTGTAGVMVGFHGTTAAPTVQVFTPQQISQLDALDFDGTHGMAVGEGNDVLLYKAGAWGREYHPSFEKLLSVKGDGTGAFVVVGHLGSLYRYDPARAVWDSLYQTRLAVQLSAALLVDATTPEAWAVGGGKLWHFAGGGWSAANLPAAPALTTATTLGAFDGRVVLGGLSGKVGTVLVFDPLAGTPDGGTGPAWASFTLRGPQVPRGVFGGGLSSSEGWVVGDYGAAWRWDHATLSLIEESSGFYGDVADLSVTADDVFVAENECTTDPCLVKAGRVMHLGATGKLEPLGTLDAGGPVFAIAARSASDVVVSGSTGVFHYDGATWNPVGLTNGYTAPILDLKWCGPTLFGVGQKGAWFKGNATTLANGGTLISGALSGLACRNENEVWAAGDGVLLARAASGAWTPKATNGVTQAPWKAVWSPGPGEAFAFGAANYGVYWNTATLTPIQQPGGVVPDEITGLWGSSIDNLYAVGVISFPAVAGIALRHDGTQWQLVDPGAQRKLTAIDGSSGSNIWVGTEGGGVLKAAMP